jgi:hypothetical protein
VLKEKPSGNQQMTEFGRTVVSLMMIRGVETRQELQSLLNEAGYRISQPAVSYYLNGVRAVPSFFFLCVCELLDLSNAERTKLAMAYSHGQDRLDPEKAEILKRLSEKTI